MFKLSNNIFLQSLFFTLIWQLALFTLYLFDLIYFNPLIELSDIIPNFFFIFFISLIFSSPLFSVILVFIIYIIGIILYFFIRQNLTLAQIRNIPELVTSYPQYSFITIILSFFIIYFLYKSSIKINFISQKIKPRIFQISICIILLALVSFGTQLYFPKIYKHNTESFNKFATWKHGGQLYSIIYHYADRKNTLIKLKDFSGKNSPILSFADHTPPKLMIMILLESFVPRSELDPNKYQPFLKKYGFKSKILESPTFGGLSARSEFEILCGIPEVEPLGDITFNYLGGKKTDFCLPSLLSDIGYKNISIIGTAPHFHNNKKAYKSLGFDRSISRDDLDKNDFDGTHPSDLTLYNRALAEILNNKNDKLFLYMFTAAGHSPYRLNLSKRPKLSDNRYLDRITYSERELEDFLDKLELLKLDSSIVVAGDHATMDTLSNKKTSPTNKKLLRVWIKSKNLQNTISNCSQYYEIPKFFTSQQCQRLIKKNKEVIGRGENFPMFTIAENLILQLTKDSQQ